MKIYLTPEALFQRMKNSDGFVVLLDNGEVISLITDSDASIQILAKFLTQYPTLKHYLNVKPEDFNPNLN